MKTVRYYILLIILVSLAVGFKKNNSVIKLGFVGDVMLGRTVNELLRKNPHHNIWGTMLPELQQQDLVIANLETAITQSTQAVPKVFNFKTDPEHTKLLTKANIKIVTLANNHVLDFAIEGFKDTLAALDAAGIAHVGAGLNDREARAPSFFTLKQTKFALLGATDNEPSWIATDTKPGINYITVGDKAFLEAITKAKAQADIVIITLHWGPNMREYPLETHIAYAHQMIDAGADIIVGHSAHVIQGIEVYKQKLILYDIGDFIDDYAVDPELRNDLTALFTVTIEDKKIEQLIITPARIDDMTVNKTRTKVAQEIIKLIQKRSSLFNTRVQEEDDQLMVVV